MPGMTLSQRARQTLALTAGSIRSLRRGLVRGGDRPGAALPLVVVEAPAEALDRDRRDRDLDPVVDRPGEPGLDAAHADADQADPRGVDVDARLEIVDRAPDVPAGVVVERVLLRLARLRPPRLDDRTVVRLGPLRAARPAAVVAGVDRDADQPAPGQLVQPGAHPLLGAARAVEHDHGGPPLRDVGRADDEGRHPLDRPVGLLLRGKADPLDGEASVRGGRLDLRVERDARAVEELKERGFDLGGRGCLSPRDEEQEHGVEEDGHGNPRGAG